MNEDWKFRSFGPQRHVFLQFDWSRIGKRSQSVPEDKPSEQPKEIIDRLVSIIGEFRTSARRVGSPLDGAPLRDVIRALRVESLGEDPANLLRTEDPTETYLREALYWELLEESGKILAPAIVGTSSDRTHANTAAIWRESLLVLQKRLGLD